MSKPKWTPGPWSVIRREYGDSPRFRIVSAAGPKVCEVDHIFHSSDARGSSIANADLLAMAPDFATEAQTLVDWWDDDDAEKPELPYEVGHALIRLRHILRMARGE